MVMLCQKCRQPLKLDGSLDDLNPAAYDLLICSCFLDTSYTIWRPMY